MVGYLHRSLNGAVEKFYAAHKLFLFTKQVIHPFAKNKDFCTGSSVPEEPMLPATVHSQFTRKFRIVPILNSLFSNTPYLLLSWQFHRPQASPITFGHGLTARVAHLLQQTRFLQIMY